MNLSNQELLFGAFSGLSIAVADSAEELFTEVDYVTNNNGGHGAVREILACYFEAVNINPTDLVT